MMLHMVVNCQFSSRYVYIFFALFRVISFAGTGLGDPPLRVPSNKTSSVKVAAPPLDINQVSQQGGLQLPTPRFQEQIVYLDGGGDNRVFLPLGKKLIASIRNHYVNAWIEGPSVKGTVLNPCVAQGFIWCSAIDGLNDNVPNPRVTFYRYYIESQAFGWELVAEVDITHGIPSMLVPLGGEGNRFLGISNGLGFFGDDAKDASFIALFRQRGGRMEFDSCVELTLDGTEPAFRKVEIRRETKEGTPSSNSQDKKTFTYCEATPRTLCPTLWYPSISANYLALAAQEAGVIWILDLKNGSVKYTLNLFTLLRADLDRVKPLKQIILGTAFAPDGQLILATREPELVERTLRSSSSDDSDKSMEQPRSSPDSEEARREKEEEENKIFQSFVEQSKKIQWWSVNPETGTKDRLDSP